MVFYTTKKPYFWNVECLNKHPFHNCAWINCGRNQELSQQTEQTLSRYLYRLLILYADDTFLMVPKRFWGSIPSTDVIWLDFWKKGGSPVCHGLKCVHIKRERVLVWNLEKENQKRHDLPFQTLKQHRPNQPEPSQPACSWSSETPLGSALASRAHQSLGRWSYLARNNWKKSPVLEVPLQS